MRTGYVYAVMAPFFLAVSVIFAKLLIDTQFEPLVLAAFRTAIGFFLLLIVVKSDNRLRIYPKREHLIWFIAFSVVGITVHYSAYYTAVFHLGPSIAVLLLYLYPAIVVLVSRIAWKQHIGSRMALSVGCALIGLLFLIIPDFKGTPVGVIGFLFGLIAAISFSTYIIMAHKTPSSYSTLEVMLFILGGATISFFLVVPNLIMTSILDLKILQFVLIVTISLFALFAYWFITAACRIIDPRKVGIICMIEPFAVLVMAALFLKESLYPIQWIGGSLIVSSSIGLNLLKAQTN